MSFLFSCFQDVVFSFQKFNCDVTWHRFWGRCCPVWRLLSFLNLLAFCQGWLVFSHYFLKYSFNPTSFPLFWDSDDTNHGSFVLSQNILEALFIFFQCVFFLCSPILSSFISTLVLSYLAIKKLLLLKF